MTLILWRVEGSSTHPNLAAWQQGLTLHLLFQSLTTIVARRENSTRHYLALEACPSCRPDGCDRVCHRVLFEQLVRIALPGVTLVPATRLAHRASESRLCVAVPHAANAPLLDAAFLSQWPEGRLITTWSRLRAKPRPVTVGALLAVGTDGPAPPRALAEASWRSLTLASVLIRKARRADVPQPVRVGVRASEALLAALRDPRSLTGVLGETDSEEGWNTAREVGGNTPVVEGEVIPLEPPEE